MTMIGCLHRLDGKLCLSSSPCNVLLLCCSAVAFGAILRTHALYSSAHPIAFKQHILQFACSKAGFLLFNLDPNPDMAKSNPEASMNALAKALELTKANVVITQEAGNDVNYIDLTTGVIPEIRIFDFSDGKPFITPRYPHLR